MTNAPESFNLDVRIRERLLKKRTITPATVESHLTGLKDVEPESVTMELEQPALAKPPVVVAQPVQPVQPVRSSVADLPPPPPGLIKESPTPPYTPMVIENLPRESSVNGVGLTANASDDDESDDLDDTDADDTDADDTDADDGETAEAAAEGATPNEEASAEGDAAAPKPEAIDDEWGG